MCCYGRQWISSYRGSCLVITAIMYVVTVGAVTPRTSLFVLLRQAVDKFLQAKGKLDGNAAPALNDVMEALHSLTTVRANLAAGLSSGEHALPLLLHALPWLLHALPWLLHALPLLLHALPLLLHALPLLLHALPLLGPSDLRASAWLLQFALPGSFPLAAAVSHATSVSFQNMWQYMVDGVLHVPSGISHGGLACTFASSAAMMLQSAIGCFKARLQACLFWHGCLSLAEPLMLLSL